MDKHLDKSTRRLPRSAGPLRGRVSVPGDKSISHRALILAALAEGRSTITGLNRGDDVRATAAMVAALGPGVAWSDNGEVVVEGKGFEGLREPDDVLDAGNSGTGLRALLGVCSKLDGMALVTGDASLRRRPMLRVVAPLRAMGARIDGRSGGAFPPLAVRGGPLRAIDHSTPVASAQVKTALLLAGLAADGTTTVREPALSRDHTERMLGAAGVEVRRTASAVSVSGGQRVSARDWAIPGDPSAAIFLIVAALVVPDSDLAVRDVCLNPTRIAAFDVLRTMGADLDVEVTEERDGEPVGDVRARHSRLRGVAIGPERMAWMIDEIPALAIAAAGAEGRTTITGASELRVKESDRLAALADGLRILGVPATERADGIEISGPARVAGGTISSRGDHRIAMAFAVAGLMSSEPVAVEGWDCVDTSFPGFLDVVASAQGSR